MNEVAIFGLIVFYKIVSILVGLAFAYMGYKLFLNDKSQNAGSLVAEGNGIKINLKRAAPGVFFSMFGAILITFSVVKGIAYSHDIPPVQETQGSGNVLQVIPDKPPF